MDSRAGQNLYFSDALSSQNIYHLTLEIPKQIFVNGYPAEIKTLGDLIRKTRMDLGLEVKQFAKQLGVCEQTVINLEMNRSQSRPRILKSVVEFLKPHVNGFMPEKEFWGFCFKNNVSYPKEHNTLGEKLRVTRMQSFLSIKQLAKQLKVAPTSIGKWERMESNPLPKSKDQIMSWINQD